MMLLLFTFKNSSVQDIPAMRFTYNGYDMQLMTSNLTGQESDNFKNANFIIEKFIGDFLFSS
jgi:hypothetical protein